MAKTVYVFQCDKTYVLRRNIFLKIRTEIQCFNNLEFSKFRFSVIFVFFYLMFSPLPIIFSFEKQQNNKLQKKKIASPET